VAVAQRSGRTHIWLKIPLKPEKFRLWNIFLIFPGEFSLPAAESGVLVDLAILVDVALSRYSLLCYRRRSHQIGSYENSVVE
jgi:hypothetical protein